MNHFPFSFKNLVISLCLFFGAQYATFGQSIETYLANGKKDLAESRYMSAIFSFENILREQPKHAETTYLAALAYLKLHHYYRALDYLMRIEASELREPESYNYWRALLHFLNEDFVETKHFIDLYEKQKNKKFNKEINELNTYLKNAEMFYTKKQDYTIINLGENINTPYSEFNPLLDTRQKSLFFNSNRATYKDDKINKDEVQIYETYLSESNLKGEWKPSSLQKANEETLTAHQIVNNNVSNGQKQLLVTSDGQLKIRKYENGKWQDNKILQETELPTQKGAHEYACLSPSGTLLVFSAANTLNEIDLYYTSRENNKAEWQKPKSINLINSKKNEITPFILEENNKVMLFFASNGHNSIGGYDIFASDFNPKTQQWTSPLNMGFPINSTADDMAFSLRGEVGYFSSNRIGGFGGEDIYKCYLFNAIKLKGKTLSRSTGAVLPNCELNLFTDYGYTQDIKSNENGEYEIDLLANELFHIRIIYDKKLLLQQDFFLSAQTVHTRKDKNLCLNFYIQNDLPDLSALEKPTEDAKAFKKTLGAIFVLNHVFFKTGSAELEEESYEELDEFAQFLTENIETGIEIGGHTDNVGKELANKKLSEERAKTIKEYLITKGIASERLTSVGYGSEMPIATNDIEEGGRALNRRIEVKVTK